MDSFQDFSRVPCLDFCIDSSWEIFIGLSCVFKEIFPKLIPGILSDTLSDILPTYFHELLIDIIGTLLEISSWIPFRFPLGITIVFFFRDSLIDSSRFFLEFSQILHPGFFH